ncbi:MAG: hypothetical protein VX777_02465 [Chlamydiota bacterium]|nr:hypothetical protein [Chlamydiota bacterium]
MSDEEQLKKMELILKNEQFDTEYISHDVDNLLPMLIVDLGRDPNGRDRFLKITIQEQEMGESLFPEGIEPKSTVINAIFQLDFPFEFDPLYTAEVSSLLHFLNQQHKLSGFVMDEVNHTVIYRQQQLTTTEGTNTKVLLSIVGLAMLFYDLHYKVIEEVGKGQITFDNVVTQIIKMAQKIPNVE